VRASRTSRAALALLGRVACKHSAAASGSLDSLEGDPYYRLDPYTGCSDCRTVLASGLIHVSTAVLRYGPKPYMVRLASLSETSTVILSRVN
jgi:hypothetical protein